MRSLIVALKLGIEHELNQRTLLLMALLYSREGISLAEMATECSCSPANITGLVDRLEVARLVIRDGTDRADRRRVPVRLTEAGVAMIKALVEQMDYEMGEEVLSA
jgi:DNA-binding MarR family transcriptional regulator